MKKTIALLSIASLGILALPVQAKHNTPELSRYDRIEQRLQNQRYRIRDGIDRGELTRKEARYLRKQRRDIAQLKHRFMYDGYLDRYEYRRLNSKLNRVSERIYRLKHNDRNHHSRRHYK